MKEKIVTFYKNLQTNDQPKDLNEAQSLLQNMPKLLTNKDNESLTTAFSDEEVYEAIFKMGKDKTPGPYGFSPRFFHTY